MSRITLHAAGDEFPERARAALTGLDAVVRPSGAGAAEVVVHDTVAGGSRIVAIGPEISMEDSLELADTFRRLRPEVGVLLVTAPEPWVWEPALRAGVADIIDPFGAIEDLRRVFMKALDTVERRFTNLESGDPEDELGRVITMVSPKGGAGKTTVASNVALGLAQFHPDDVVIVDLDLEFGDISNSFLLEPEHTMFDATRDGTGLDVTTLKVFLTRHKSGLHALCAPGSPELGEDIKPERVVSILDRLRHQFRWVIVDTAAGLDEHALTSLEVSTDVVLVADMDVPSVRALRKAVDALDRVGMIDHRRHFVLNRSDSKVGLSAEDVATTLGMQVSVALPSSRLIPLSVNQGSPILESNPKAPVARKMAEVVALFTEAPEKSSRLPWRSER